MAEQQLKIFSDDSIVLPGESGTDIDTKELMQGNIEESITGEVVENVNIPKENQIDLPNYVIDLSEIDELELVQIHALDCVLDAEGDVTVYAYLKGSMVKLGMGHREKLDRLLVLIIKHIYENKALLYKDFEIGKPVKVVSDKSITHLRLSL